MKALSLAILISITTLAADLVQPQKTAVSAAGVYVPVSLDAHASHDAKAGLTESHITVQNIPFNLVTKAGADNLFLKSAEWSDWKEDPSSYYSNYDKGPQPGDPKRPIIKVPVADYSVVFLLAACDNDRSLSNVVTFRMGAMDGARRVALHDFSATVPRFDEAKKAGMQAIATPAGNLFLVRVPLGLAFAQDFKDEWAFDVELTKELKPAIRSPDPCRFNMRPLGLPSGVHIFGMTFQRSPVQMTVTCGESGNVFNEPQVPRFQVNLKLVGARAANLSLVVTTTDLDGNQTTKSIESIEMPKHGNLTTDITVPVKRRGYHELSISLMQGRAELLRRETTLALLPKDTRKHRDESPFGTWDFGGAHYTPSDADVVGPLYVKAGLRYGMFPFTAEERAKYGVLNGSEPRNGDLLGKKLSDDPKTPKSVLIFHENAISGAHIMRTPDVFTGKPPYKLDEKEQEKFDAMWKEATATAQAVRKQFPDAKLAFGNGNPHLMEEFARHRFPSELFDSRGNEAGSFMRMPETQPLDFVANNASIWMDRQILDHYGYGNKPITQCYEVCYPSTNPGNLSLRTQAAYYVRHMIHSLVWGIPIVRPACITDVGNSYYFSNWGACGLCFAKPDVRPKPSYVAMATLTQQLDGATFSRIIDTGSPVVYAVEFKKREGGFVTVAWTVNEHRELKWGGLGESAKADISSVIDVNGNPELSWFSVDSFLYGPKVGPSPIFVHTSSPLPPAKYNGRKEWTDTNRSFKSRAFAISPLSKLTDLQIETQPNTELEWFNFECPRRKGDFEFAEVAEFEGEKTCLSIKPKPVAGSAHLPMYQVLSLKKPVELKDKPTELGLSVNGNGGWGRIIFELTDASGQRFTSIGAAMKGEATRWMADWMSEKELAEMKDMHVADWNTNDPWQRSRINFEGWHYLKFPLPGQYEGEGYHWPAGSQWKATGDGVVKYPLTFTKLVIELPEKVLYLNKMITVPRAEIYIKGLQATYEPIEKVSAAP